MVSLGATTHEGALTRQLPELLVEELLELEELLAELELLEELAELEELLDDDSPPQLATVKAPRAPRACRRVK